MSRFYAALKEASRTRRSEPNGGGAPADIASDLAMDRPLSNEEPVSRLATGAAPSRDDQSEQVVVAGALSNVNRDGDAVPVHASLDRGSRVLPHIADSAVLEHYRRLRTKLLQENEARPFRSLVIASSNPEEGKTVTAVNLALSFAMLPSCRVLLVDGDLRKGSLGKWLGVEGPPGLSNLVEGTSSFGQVVLKSADVPCHFMLRGNSKLSAAELLNSVRLKESLRQMSAEYDLVVVDSPPLALVTDAQLLAGCCDAALLVVRAFSTTRKAVEQALRELQPSRVIGTVLNAGSSGRIYRRYNQYY